MEKILPLHKRFVKYLIAVYKKDPVKPVQRNTLFSLAINRGYTKKEIWGALKKVDNNPQVAKYTEEGLGVCYTYLNYSKEELKKIEEDNKWFDSLPDYVPDPNKQPVKRKNTLIGRSSYSAEEEYNKFKNSRG